MAPLNDETQTQLLELIQGIKGAQERQNILLEKLVEVIAASADDSGQKEDANREVNDTAEETHSTNRESKNTNEAKDSGEEVIVEKPETSPASDGPINEHDREVEERFGSLPDEFKKRIKIYTGSDDHERLLLEVLCGTVKALDGYQRNPADGTELGCTTNDWKYWCPQGVELSNHDEQSMGSSKGLVPDFIPWWELVRGDSEDAWYHVDDTDRT
ncbi:hypothetical protein ACJZ2D_009182 [Fusarium nematophilum]